MRAKIGLEQNNEKTVLLEQRTVDQDSLSIQLVCFEQCDTWSVLSDAALTWSRRLLA